MRADRLKRANEFLEVIGSHGRGFFRYKDRVACFELDHRGRIWFVDEYTQKRIYTHLEYPHNKWRGFTGGGTLKKLVQRLRQYIQHGTKLSESYFNWPDWCCGGDLWGYGDAMNPVREAAERLEIMNVQR